MSTRTKRVTSLLKEEFSYHFPATHPRKILFDHLPKCGGSTLDNYLAAHYPRRKIFSMDGFHPLESARYFKQLPKQARHGYSLVKGHLANELFDYVHPECLKVTVLRDPVERIISHYFYVKRTPDHYLYPAIQRSGMSLEDYAASGLGCELRNWYTTHFSGLPVDEAEKSPEESIKSATEIVLQRYDIVGFLDDFQSFIEVLRERANLRNEYQENRINVTQDRPGIESIPRPVIETIEQVNHLDIDLYWKIRDTIS